ncbi:hypothetical protein D3C81_887360 [compost metagenome]
MSIAGQIEASCLVAKGGGDRLRIHLQCDPRQQVIHNAAIAVDALHSLLQRFAHQLPLRGAEQRVEHLCRVVCHVLGNRVVITQELQHTALDLHHQRLVAQMVCMAHGDQTQAALFVRTQGNGPGQRPTQVSQGSSRGVDVIRSWRGLIVRGEPSSLRRCEYEGVGHHETVHSQRVILGSAQVGASSVHECKNTP